MEAEEAEFRGASVVSPPPPLSSAAEDVIHRTLCGKNLSIAEKYFTVFYNILTKICQLTKKRRKASMSVFTLTLGKRHR